RERFYKENYSGTAPNLCRATIGAVSELEVAADLMRREFEVFRALSPAASCDLIAIREGRILRIEVRTAYDSIYTGKETSVKSARDLGRQDHFAYRSKEKIRYEPPLG